MKEIKIQNESVVLVESLQEALTLDTEMKDVNIIIINNVSTKGNWKEAREQNHIPQTICDSQEYYGRIVIRVGLGYHYLYDTLDKSWVKPVDTDTRSILSKYLAEK